MAREETLESSRWSLNSISRAVRVAIFPVVLLLSGLSGTIPTAVAVDTNYECVDVNSHHVRVIYYDNATDSIPNRYTTYAPALRTIADLSSARIKGEGAAMGAAVKIKFLCSGNQIVVDNVSGCGSPWMEQCVSNPTEPDVNRVIFWVMADIDGCTGSGNPNGGGGGGTFTCNDLVGSTWKWDNPTDPAINAWQLHEWMHTYIGISAYGPHAYNGGHCWDGNDIMCYHDTGENGNNLAQYEEKICIVPVGGVPTVDCNKDDYFNPCPAPYMWIYSHPSHNVASTSNPYISRSGCSTPPTNLCSNGLDDDGDGGKDYDGAGTGLVDYGCSSYLDNTEAGNPACSDGADNDGDGGKDDVVMGFAIPDRGCVSPFDQWEKVRYKDIFTGQWTVVNNPACGDATDNDADTKTDHASPPTANSDLGCVNWRDHYEAPDVLACGDMWDNDGDGWTDGSYGWTAVDPDCTYLGTASELPACSNGIDDDGDLNIDMADTHCVSTGDRTEQDAGSCQDGIDNDGDGRIDGSHLAPYQANSWYTDPSCTWFAANESVGTYVCADGIDNDGDGKKDYNPNNLNFPWYGLPWYNPPQFWAGDPGCASATDPDGSEVG